MLPEQSEGIHLVQTSENPARLREPGERAVIAVAVTVVVAVAAWTAAVAFALSSLTSNTEQGVDLDKAVLGLGLAVVSAALTLVSVNLGLDIARRRRLRAAIDAIRTETQAAIRSELTQIAEDLGALAREVEQLGAKINASYWSGYEAGATDARGGGDGASISRLPHRAQ